MSEATSPQSTDLESSPSGSERPLTDTTPPDHPTADSSRRASRSSQHRPPMLMLPNEVPNMTDGSNGGNTGLGAATVTDVDSLQPVRVRPTSPFTAAMLSPTLGRGWKSVRRSLKQIHVQGQPHGIQGIEMTKPAPSASPTRTKAHHDRGRGSVVAHKHHNSHHHQHHSHHVNTAMEQDVSTSGSSGYRFGFDGHGERVSCTSAIKNHLRRHWILNPKSTMRGYWNLVIFVIILFYVVEIPLRLGFQVDNCNTCATTIMHLLCDIFFCIDCLCLQMRTSYFIENSNQTLLELNPRKIAINYLRGWFTLDLLTSVPLHHVLVYYYDVSLSENVYVSAFVQFAYLVRMLKVVRFAGLLQYYHSVEGSAGTLWSDLIKVLKFIFGFFVIAHMSACMWMFIALQERNNTNIAVIASVWNTRSWPGGLGYIQAPNLTEVIAQWEDYSIPLVGQNYIYEAQTQIHLAAAVVPLTVNLSYLMALYWAVSAMTTVGYGDIVPRNDAEMGYAVVVIFVGSLTFGYIISNVSTIIQVEDDADTKIRAKITSINAYMAYRKLPPELQKKIRTHYEYVWQRKTVYDERVILQDLPTQLRTRVALYLNADLIRNVAFLRELGADCLALLVIELRPFRVAAGFWIFKQGSLGREMVFVHEGMVEVLGKKNKQLAILQKGSYFGEFAILSDRPTKRSASVRALATTDLFALTKESFETVLKIYPELKEEVQAHAEARLKEAMEGRAERDYNSLQPSAKTPETPLLGPQLGGGSLGSPARPTTGPRSASIMFGSPNLTGLAGHMRTPGLGPIPSASSVSPAVSMRLGFNPYLSLPHSRADDLEAENAIRRTVLRGKGQLESIMHPELADEIKLEADEAEAQLDAQIAAEKEFITQNAAFFQRSNATAPGSNAATPMHARSATVALPLPVSASSRANGANDHARMSLFRLDPPSSLPSVPVAPPAVASAEQVATFLAHLSATVRETLQPLPPPPAAQAQAQTQLQSLDELVAGLGLSP